MTSETIASSTDGAPPLLKAELRLTPDDRKQVHALTFEVPPGLWGIGIWIEVSPRASGDAALNGELVDRAVALQLARAAADGVQLSDADGAAAGPGPTLTRLRRSLRNLLNVVIADANDNHRGRWDRNLPRQRPQQSVIAETLASPGFVAGPLPAGRWRATVEVHEVITPACELRLVIEGLQTARRSVRSTPARRALAPARCEYETPLPPGWLRGELHSHSSESDGLYPLEQLVERATAIGLDFLAVTDHNVYGPLEPPAGAPIPLLPGCEITTFVGHFPAYGLDGTPAWHREGRVIDPRQLASEIHGQGGLFGLAHPFVLGNPICCGCRLDAELQWAELDLLEVWTRGYSDPLADRHALARFDRLRQAGLPVAAVAGRDWHGPAQERATSGRRYPATVVRAEPTIPSLLDALRRGALYLSVGPTVDLRLHGARRCATLGETLADDPAPLGLELELAALEGPCLMRLFNGGKLALEQRLTTPTVSIARDGIVPTAGGVRLELWDEQGQPLLLTNPICR